MKKQFLLFAIAVFIQFAGYAQKNAQASIDSLLTQFKVAKEDTLKMRLLADVMDAYIYFKPQEGLNYQATAMQLAQKANWPIGKARIKDRLGRLNWRMGNFGEALKDHEEALDIYNRAGDKYKNYVLIEIGQDYLDSGKYAPAESYLIKALKLSKEAGDKKTMSNTYDVLVYLYNAQGKTAEMTKMVYEYMKLCEEMGDKRGLIGVAYMSGTYYESLGNHQEALKYFSLGLQTAEGTGNKMDMATFQSMIGGLSQNMGNMAAAQAHYSAALSFAREVGDRQLIAGVSVGLGNLYQDQGKYSEAILHYKNAKQNYAETKDKQNLAIVNYKLGATFTSVGQYDLARKAFAASNAIYKQLNTPLLSMGDYYQGMQGLDLATGNWKGAYENYQHFIEIRDSAFNKETLQKEVSSQLQFENEKKETIAKAEQDKKDALVSVELSRQKIIRNFSIAGAITILILGVYLYYDFQRRKKLEGLQALSDERLRIGRELHDDIGSTLGSIAVYSDVAKNRSQKNEDPGEALSKIGMASRELIEKMSDIVWSLNPENENFEQLQNRMEAFAAMILTARNIAFEFKTDGGLKTVALTNEQRRNIFMIYKEALHNILKYASCQHVLIAISRSGSFLSLSIQDDGIGFDALAFDEGRGHAYNGNGLKNMKARAREMNATFDIVSERGKGTSVEVKIKV